MMSINPQTLNWLLHHDVVVVVDLLATWLRTRSNPSLPKAILPIPPIKGLHLHARNRPRIHAAHRHSHPVGVRPGDIKGRDPTHFAEVVLGGVRAEGVEREKRVRGGVECEVLLGNDEVCVAAHGAVGAVAVPRCDGGGGFDGVADSAAVAAALVEDDCCWSHRCHGDEGIEWRS